MKQRLALVAAVAAALACVPGAAAHARLVATDPQQGDVLAQAPRTATFSFDDPVRSGGDATLAGGKLGRTVALPTDLRGGGRRLVATLPARLPHGDYVVTWRIVSDDGHRETGALAFGVGARTPAPAPVVSQQTESDITLGAARWIFLLGLLAASGLAAVRLALGRHEPGAAAAALAASLSLAGFGALLELSRLPGALDTRFGVVTAVAAGVAFAGVVAALVALNVPRVLAAAEAAALALVVAPPLAGHALAPDRPVALAFPADLVHTAAAAVWIGGVLWVGVLALRGSLAGALRFTRIALVAVVVLGASGVARAAAELESLDDVWTTSYGGLLLAKSALYAALLGAGRLSARFAGRSRAAGFRRSVAVEAVVLGAVVAAVAALGSVTPPRNRPEPLPSRLPGVPVVFGREAGRLAVGIAAVGSAGRLGVEATVLAASGLPADGLDVALSANGGPWLDAAACGIGRYCVTAPAGGPAPRGRVRVARPGGPTWVLGFSLPARPRHALARRIVGLAAAATRGLHTVVIHERLSADPTLRLDTVFTIEARDRMKYRSTERRGGRARAAGAAVVIDGTRWDRDSPAGAWTRSTLEPLDQPVPDWQAAVDASVLGEGRLDGQRVWRVSFRDPTIPAWFELAVEQRELRPLHVEMTAAAHFMVRDWGSFDEPVTIEPPIARR